MKLLSAVLGLGLCLLAPRMALAASAGIAVLPLEVGPGVDAKLAEVVTTGLVQEIERRAHTDVIATKDIQTALGFERQRQLVGCSNEESCLAELAGALGTRLLVSGSLARVGESYVFSAQLFDLTASRVARRFQHRVKASSPEAFLDAVPIAAEALFPDVAAPPAASMSRRTTGWLIGGAGVVAGGVGALLGVQSLRVAEGATAPGANYSVELASAQRFAIGADALYVLGGAGLCVGAWLIVTGSSNLHISLVPSPHAPAIAVGGSF